MTKGIRTKPEERPLTEVIEERKNYYLGRIVTAFNFVYEKGDFEYIGQFENALSRLSDNAVKGRNLGDVVKETPKIDLKTEGRGGRKPLLTVERYKTAVEEGLTRAQVEEKYHVNTRQIGPFARHYGRLKSE